MWVDHGAVLAAPPRPHQRKSDADGAAGARRLSLSSLRRPGHGTRRAAEHDDADVVSRDTGVATCWRPCTAEGADAVGVDQGDRVGRRASGLAAHDDAEAIEVKGERGACGARRQRRARPGPRRAVPLPDFIESAHAVGEAARDDDATAQRVVGTARALARTR